jgi:hypothetical protein
MRGLVSGKHNAKLNTGFATSSRNYSQTKEGNAMGRLSDVMLIGCVGLVVALAMPIEATAQTCPIDSVRVGTICLDKFEASVWKILPTTLVQRNVIIKIRAGTVTLSDLKQAGAVQLGLTDGDIKFAGCFEDGWGCTNVYAVSIGGVLPARYVNWFQAAAAARNSFKRLPTNAEWQVGAFGTFPDLPDDENGCNVGGGILGGVIDFTGGRSSCFSDTGNWDMVGNLSEWVADWMPKSTPDDCGIWGDFIGGAFADVDDISCLKPASSPEPGALFRGGSFAGGTRGGIFSVSASVSPALGFPTVGFRAAR